jgi:ATP-dependent Clp protease adaptor protein ClpS
MNERVVPVRVSTMPAEAEPEVLPDDPETDELGETELEESVTTDRPWIVIVWNDPVNLMSYVVFVFQKLFGYSREKATRLMMQVHKEGRAVVSDGTREKCEADVSRLHAHGLWATMEHPA